MSELLDAFKLSNNKTLVGWNQVVYLGADGGTLKPYKVTNCSIGIKQDTTVPPLVTGKTDALAFQKGVIKVAGSINTPLTNAIGSLLLKAACDTASGGGAIAMQSSMIKSDVELEIKINSCTITANKENPIELTVDFIGRVKSNDPQYSSATSELFAWTGLGNPDGVDATGMATEQIPMFDRVSIDEAFLPVSIQNAIPTNISFTIANNLKENYVLGVGGTSSLNAFSISAGQRMLTGKIGFQSGLDGTIGIVAVAGTGGNGGFRIYKSQDPDGSDPSAILIDVSGDDYYPVWNAAPPTLSTELVTYESEFKLIAKTPGFHITIG
jgi:hypothetical protein